MGPDFSPPSATGSPPRLRFHGFRIPRRVGLRGTLLAAVPGAITFIIALSVIGTSKRVQDLLGGSWQLIWLPVATLPGVLVAGGIALYLGWSRRRNTPPGRMRRLRRLCRHKGTALTRFPHRLIEIKLRKGGKAHRVVQRVAGWSPPGLVLLINPPVAPLTMANGLWGRRRFEPIALEDAEGLSNQPRPEGVALGRPARAGRAHREAPVGGNHVGSPVGALFG